MNDINSGAGEQANGLTEREVVARAYAMPFASPRLHCRARQILRSPRTYGKILSQFDQAHASHHFRRETGVTSNGRRRDWLSMQTLTTDNVAGGEGLMRRSSDVK
jgi:hypothetical protein